MIGNAQALLGTTIMVGRHVMIDLETMATSAAAIITQVGAVAFYPAEGRVSATERFNRHVSLHSSMALGRALDPDTFLWWLKQDDDARWAFINGQKDAPSLSQVLLELEDFCLQSNGRGLGSKKEEPAGVWGHGASFDPVLVDDSYAACNLKTPWSYKGVRDTRTLFQLAGLSLSEYTCPEPGPLHVALSDAVAQAYATIEALGRIQRMP